MNETQGTAINIKNKKIIYHFTKQQNLLLIIHNKGSSYQLGKNKQIKLGIEVAKQAQSSNLQFISCFKLSVIGDTYPEVWLQHRRTISECMANGSISGSAPISQNG